MSVVLPVERITPQTLSAILIEIDTHGQTQGVVSALFAALIPNGYTTQSQTGPEYPGQSRLTISHAGSDQFAYPGDWLLVTDAEYSVQGWEVAPTTNVVVYGISAGLAGTAVDFVNTYTVNTEMVWGATTTPPIATALDGLQAAVAFPQPVSPNGPFTYTLAGPGTPGEFSGPAEDGTVTVTVTGLTEGAECFWSVAVATQYAGVGATSQPSNTVTAATTVPVPPPPEVPFP